MTIYRQDLERVYALIEKPENWCQHTVARDKDNHCADPLGPNASKWCIDGAICRTTGGNYNYAEWCKAIGGKYAPHLVIFNDAYDRKHQEVLALLRQAIERAPVRTDRGEA